MQRPMLKTIIEHDAIDGILLQHPPTKCRSVGSHSDNGLRTTLRYQKGLISSLGRTR
jgi:hypothetical protein